MNIFEGAPNHLGEQLPIHPLEGSDLILVVTNKKNYLKDFNKVPKEACIWKDKESECISS